MPPSVCLVKASIVLVVQGEKQILAGSEASRSAADRDRSLCHLRLWSMPGPRPKQTLINALGWSAIRWLPGAQFQSASNPW